jgi:hypothetical protein
MSCSREREAWGRDARLAHGREGGASREANSRARGGRGAAEASEGEAAATIFNLAHCAARFPNVLPHPALSP